MVKEEGLALTSSVSPTLPNTLLAPIMAPKTLDVQIAAKKGTFNGKFTVYL
jgi:hypothetical protein